MSKRRNRTQHVTVRSTCTDKRGRIISTAINDYHKSHPVQAKLAKKVGQPARIFLHSEINAILKSRGRKIHKIFVERYDFAGNPKNAAPCPICAEFIRISGIKLVEYTVG